MRRSTPDRDFPCRPALRAPAGTGALAGKRVVVTSGPTHEPIDPVRYIANRSSANKAMRLPRRAEAGADVALAAL